MMRYISEIVQHEVYAGVGEDEMGDEIETWGDPVDLGIYAFNPGGTAEPFLSGHDRVIIEPTIYVPSSAVIGPHDHIEVRGVRYTVEGVARDFRNPYNSAMNGLSVALKAVGG